MKNNRYSIALIPDKNYYDVYIQASHKNFKPIASGYLLGKDSDILLSYNFHVKKISIFT